ncbi:hypothetical protein DPMN_187948 [Dreissena polymorpha]|uniref:Uncharacterized protein n=1 Tax=Dreissena polymorpha TaxID=45954 RepID=A0A9D4DQE7_DREPO|nr:hypothetical protein DPMN_187948 [Dreissena polymorpha]
MTQTSTLPGENITCPTHMLPGSGDKPYSPKLEARGTKRTIAILLEKIEEKKDDGTLIELNTLLKKIETKVEMLETLNEKILSNTETEEIEDAIVETDIYLMDLCMKLDTLIADRDQRDTSIGSQG